MNSSSQSSILNVIFHPYATYICKFVVIDENGLRNREIILYQTDVVCKFLIYLSIEIFIPLIKFLGVLVTLQKFP